MTNAHRGPDKCGTRGRDRRLIRTFSPAAPPTDDPVLPATIISYSKTMTVRKTVPVPPGFTVETTNRYPRENEYYCYVNDDDEVSALRQATAEDRGLCGLVADYNRDRFVIFVKKSRMVSTFTETGEYRLPLRGEYYGRNGEIRIADVDVTTPARIVTCQRSMVQG